MTGQIRPYHNPYKSPNREELDKITRDILDSSKQGMPKDEKICTDFATVEDLDRAVKHMMEQEIILEEVREPGEIFGSIPISNEYWQ